jgi:radical SAM protein with 4Fe4S-binding SPASM domain
MSVASNTYRLPKQLYIESTNRCNLKCKGCIQFKGPWEAARDISLEELCRITNQLPELERVVLHGIGEPLLNDQLPAMIRHLKARGIVVLINSNGILLNDRWRRVLTDSGLDELRISLDAASRSGYAQMRGSDKFDQIIDNLKALKALQTSGHTRTPAVSLWYLGTRDNIAELPEVVRLAADIAVEEVYLQRLVYFHDHPGYGVAVPQKTLQDSDAEFMALIQESRESARALGIGFNCSGLCRPDESLKSGAESETPWCKCSRPSTLMYITARGNVLPCCIAPFATSDYPSIILGNVFETSLQEIWSGERYSDFREKQRSATPPKCCRGCGVLWSL